MQSAFIAHLHQLIPSIEDKKVYVAVSGGIDSLVLLHLCIEASLYPTALHCNFNLRGEDSNGDEAFVEAFCKDSHIDYESIQFKTADIAKINKQSIQECARDLRYEWFHTFLDANDQAVLLTGHHLDDSVETFFINLLRGTGLKGLTGIQSVREQIYRPLLPFRKTDLKLYSENHKIDYREDKSNSDLKYTRNKIRNKVIPLLNEITPQFDSKLIALIEELKLTNEFLDNYTEEIRLKIIVRQNNEDKIVIEDLKSLPLPIQIKLLGQYDIHRSQLEEIIKLYDSETGAIFENNAYTLLKDRKHIIIKENVDSEVTYREITDFTSQYKIGNNRFKCSVIDNRNIQFSPETAHFDLDRIQGSIIITNKHKGLRIQPLGMKGNKLVSDILIDEKLNRFQKINQLVMTHQSDTIWIVGKTIHQKYCITSKTKRVLKIEMLE